MRARSQSIPDGNKIIYNRNVSDALMMPNRAPIIQEPPVGDMQAIQNNFATMQAEIMSLKQQLSTMQENTDRIIKEKNNEIKELQKIVDIFPRKLYSPVNSDEEEKLVNEETTWILPKNKKRKVKHSPEKIAPAIAQNQKEVKTAKPPPVVVNNVVNYPELTNKLSEENLRYQANMLNNGQVKITVQTEQDYRTLTSLMNDTEMKWHSYENKQTRPIRVMVKNLHPLCDPKDISSEL